LRSFFVMRRYMQRWGVAAVLAMLTAWGSASAALAVDTVKMIEGKPLVGTVNEMTPTEITLQQGALGNKVPVNEIALILFEGEPKDLANGRNLYAAGRYAEALPLLSRIDLESLKRDEIKQDAEFYKAITSARLALSGSGSIAAAGKLLTAFDKNNPTSFHALETAEALGDMFGALGKYDQAEKYYAKLAAAPWPDYKMKAGVATGRALLAQKKFDEAQQKFVEVEAMDTKGKQADRHRAAASLGKAAVTFGKGKPEDAIKETEDLITKTEEEDADLYARAYNLIGNCQLAAGKKKDARTAFLHVDLLYAGVADQHAEALYQLSKIWAELDHVDRANVAKRQLQQRYPNSPWAKKEAPAKSG
jgi:tetratricopeptide (TPR) repeat protein